MKRVLERRRLNEAFGEPSMTDVGVTRREALIGAGSLAFAGPEASRADESAPSLKLRLLETSDLHMFVLDWDYYHAKPDPTVEESR